jgi:nicotinate-nucleotide adenylyltransferase
MGRLRSKRIGVMGGTFDPIHTGHLLAAQEALEQFKLDEVIFVPAAASPFKQDEAVSDAEHRYLMAVIATAANRAFRVSRVEMERPAPSYTVDTMRLLKKACGTRSEMFFIAGADTVLEMGGWKEPEALLELCTLIAINRPGDRVEAIRKSLTVKERKRFAGHPRIAYMDMPGMDISSTDIRRRVREGKALNYLVPETVEAYILKNGLYR